MDILRHGDRVSVLCDSAEQRARLVTFVIEHAGEHGIPEVTVALPKAETPSVSFYVRDSRMSRRLAAMIGNWAEGQLVESSQTAS